MTDASELIEKRGFVWFRGALGAAELAELSMHCGLGSRPGGRPEPVAELLQQLSLGSTVGDLARHVLPSARPVRLVAFNKTESTNWSVPWHQDRVIAVAERHALDGYSNWMRKNTYWHVEPPESVLREMIFARICFDHANAENGTLQLAIGSHEFGIVSASEAKSQAESCALETCQSSPGDVLFIKALTLHRSASAAKPSQRRALRVDYAGADLPSPLNWALDRYQAAARGSIGLHPAV